jgi:hypothetical protein
MVGCVRNGANGGNMPVAEFGYSVNEAMVELTKEMERYHRNWAEFAEPH